MHIFSDKTFIRKKIISNRQSQIQIEFIFLWVYYESKMETEFITGIIEDQTLGFIIKPFIITKLRDKGFYPIEAQLSEYNFSRYEKELTPTQQKIFRLTQEYSDKNLQHLFDKKKKKSTKEYIAHLDKKTAEQQIRPFIEKRHAKIIDEVRKNNIEAYIKDKHKFINRDNQVRVLKEPAQTVLNIIKESDETRYYLSVNQDRQTISLLDKAYIILSHDPCRIIIDDKLFSFEDVDAKKLKPFFEKQHILIPRQFEKKWFETFALPNIKKFEVNARGFRIESPVPKKKAALSIEHDLQYNPVFCLKFYYDEESFYAGEHQKNKVRLKTENDTYHFYKIERDTAWEQNIMDELKKLGIEHTHASYYTLTQVKDLKDKEIRFYELLEQTKTIVQELEKFNICLKQDKLDRTYSLLTPQIEANITESNDWFDIQAFVKVGEYRLPFIKLKNYILKGIREIQLPNGSYAVLPGEWFSRYADMFKFGRVEGEKLILHKHHFKIIEKSLERISNSYLERLKTLSEAPHQNSTEIPGEISATLRSYQQEGFQWMYMLSRHHFGGCLADDMGLGKTLQTLTLLLKIKNEVPRMEVSEELTHSFKQLNLFEQQNSSAASTVETTTVSPTFLIVMPTSLIYNWRNEIRKFTPQLSVYNFTGLNRTKNPKELYHYDIVLTTYGTVRNDFNLLSQVSFYYVILDESQYIKNPSSKTYQAVNELKSRFKMVLTGTPIENSLSDLWAQLNFLNPGLLGNFNFFKNEFIQPIEKYHNEHQKVKLQAMISPFILRRTKYEVAKELPQKTEQIIYCEMTDEQRSYYEEEKSKVRNSLIDNLEDTDSGKPAMKILEGLSILRQSANHPAMVDESYSGASGKFEEITEYVHSIISEDHKVLIFSSYKKHLRLLARKFDQEHLSYSLLTGETYNREKEVQEFQENDGNKIFLIQIKAGGFGLNLTAADYVLILDPWWNPAVEEQAINRAHRIGQDKNVMVYRFITLDTVEEKIQKLQRKKAQLAETFITSHDTIKHLSREQILDLFS